MRKNEGSAKKSEFTTDLPASLVLTEIDRMKLLASVAGTVASGVVASPSKAITSAADVAEISVSIADDILKRIGI